MMFLFTYSFSFRILGLNVYQTFTEHQLYLSTVVGGNRKQKMTSYKILTLNGISLPILKHSLPLFCPLADKPYSLHCCTLYRQA